MQRFLRKNCLTETLFRKISGRLSPLSSDNLFDTEITNLDTAGELSTNLACNKLYVFLNVLDRTLQGWDFRDVSKRFARDIDYRFEG